MKGVIAQCLKGLIVDGFGEPKWQAVARGAGVDPSRPILASSDVPDEVVGKLIQSTCVVLGINRTQAADAFGDYWAMTFAPKVYASVYERASNAAEFLMNINDVHVTVTRTMPSAAPPRFVYRWEDDRSLVIEYQSKRKMFDIVMGLAKGVAHYYNDAASVTRVNDNTMKVVFEKARRPKN
jgi:hypothetical protein